MVREDTNRNTRNIFIGAVPALMKGSQDRTIYGPFLPFLYLSGKPARLP